MADVVRAVAYAMPALEIVGSRIKKWDIGMVDTSPITPRRGSSFLGGPVRRSGWLGSPRPPDADDEERTRPSPKGTGAACLGNRSTRWPGSPASLARRKRPLRAGDVVLSGALGPMVPVKPGEHSRPTIARARDRFGAI